MLDLDLSPYPTIDWAQFSWLLSKGIAASLLVEFTEARVVRGVSTTDGRLDLDPDGDSFIAFPEDEDFVFWSPVSGKLATWNGRCFALGADNIMSTVTYAFDNYLTVHPCPIAWLRDQCRGIVVLNWNLAFDMLRDVPRIAVSERLLPTYRQHMKPRRLPELAVIARNKRQVA